MHSSLSGSGQDVYHVRFAWCQTVSATVEDDSGDATTLEDDVFEMEESGPGTEAEVTVDDEVGASTDDDTGMTTDDEAGMIFDEFGATFHEFEVFSSVQAVKASTPKAANILRVFIISHPILNSQFQL